MVVELFEEPDCGDIDCGHVEFGNIASGDIKFTDFSELFAGIDKFGFLKIVFCSKFLTSVEFFVVGNCVFLFCFGEGGCKFDCLFVSIRIEVESNPVEYIQPSPHNST